MQSVAGTCRGKGGKGNKKNACANNDSERDTSTDGHSAGKGIHLFLDNVVGLSFE